MVMLTEKKNTYESCELSFTGDKMRTIAWERACQIALRSCCDEVVEVNINVILVEEDTCDQAHILAEGCCLS